MLELVFIGATTDDIAVAFSFSKNVSLNHEPYQAASSRVR
jgi:hypothetical protein